MKLRRSPHTAVTTALATAACAFLAGTAVAPASDITPAHQLSTIREVPVEEYETHLNLTTNADGKLIANPADQWKWLITAYNHQKNGTSGTIKYLEATSPAMGGRKVPLAVIAPNGDFSTPRPTIYLLNGAGGADQGMDWITETANRTDANGKLIVNENVVEFYLKKNVNVVIPQAGAFSYYTDWLESPESNYLKGPQKWETFLVKELPGPLEEHIKGNGKRAIAGMSMSATSSLLLAEHNPGFYDAVGSYSGCAATSTPFPRTYAELTVNRGGGTVDQMWGPMGGKYNVYNDALINSNNLAKSEVYVSTNSGIPGENDLFGNIMDRLGGSSFANSSAAFKSSSTLTVEGGAIEGAMNDCTTQLKRKMDREGVKADWVFRPTGTHSWPGWRSDIHESWPTYARAFGMNEDPNYTETATPVAPEANATTASDTITVAPEQGATTPDPQADATKADYQP